MKQKNDSSPSTGNKILPLEECLAKTRHDADGNIGPGVNVETHCLATFEVARQLLKYYSHFCTASLWDPPKDLLAPLLHDVGKVSPRFQKKIYSAFQKELPESISEVDTGDENHCITSALVLDRWGLEYLSWVAASHHGSFCSSKDQDLRSTQYGGKVWNALRDELIQKLLERSGLEWVDISKEKKELVLGLTILADWLSSGMDLKSGEDPTPEMYAEVVRNAGFVPFTVRNNLTFKDLFQTENQTCFEPNEVQKTMLEEIKPGGIYILETEMGSGKTEAALALAYELLKSHRHAGIYFALPTQLTSNKIYERFEPFKENILKANEEIPQTRLLHSKSWLENRNEQLKKKLQNDGKDGFQEKNRKADSWFSSSKRGLLAPFAVGTIDQILMSVINIRHNALRTLGAAGKVVILDEVHSYDAYTGSLIQTLVEYLRKWKCTIIILSATLTKKVRDDLLNIKDVSKIENKEQETEYPLLSILDGNEVLYRKIDRSKINPKKVKITHKDSIENTYDAAIDHAKKGECILWIENTVADAQKVFQELVKCELKGVEIGLIHSRFQETTRHKNENEWVKKYGKNTTKEGRAGGKILIGTQVLEQSVDIDADFLVTRLCPTDMLLQRIGRLWRHESLNPFRPKSAHPEVLILNETPFQNKVQWSDFETTPPVYAPYILMRSQEVFEKRSEIVIPRDMRELIELTYSEREDEKGWYVHLKKELDKKCQKLKDLAYYNTIKVGNAKPDTEASTRYCEFETVEVLLIKDFNKNEITPYNSDQSIPIPPKNAPKEKCIECAIKLSPYLVRVPIYKSPNYEGFPLDELSHIFYTGHDDKDRPLRAAYVGKDNSDLLRKRDCTPAKAKDSMIQMRYNSRIGYYTEEMEDK